MIVRSSNSPYFTLTLPNEFLTYNVRVAAVIGQRRVVSGDISLCPGMNREAGMTNEYTVKSMV